MPLVVTGIAHERYHSLFDYVICECHPSEYETVECIKQFQNKTTWYRAKATCIAHGSHLLELNSHPESENVFRAFNCK